jgi:hypothetical protein
MGIRRAVLKSDS